MTDGPPRPRVDMPPLGLIVAMSRDRCIGRDGQLPWRIPEDLKHVKRITTGHAILMGRRTYESIGRPLPNRRNIVITRQEGYAPEGVEIAGSFGDALALAREGDPMPIVFGGSAIYEIALPQVTRIWMTEVDGDVDGDAFFPPLVPGEWVQVDRVPAETEGVTFVTLDRILAPQGGVAPRG